jgi:hypothetical protein
MRVNTKWQPLWLELAERGANLLEMQEKTGKSLDAVVTWLTRWLRWTGTVDVSAWVEQDLQLAIAVGLSREPPPAMKQLAAELAIGTAPIRLVATALWNRNHPVAYGQNLQREFELDDLLAQRMSLAELVRATGLSPTTVEGYIAAYLAAQPEPDATPWLEEAQVTHISALLDGPNSWHNLRRAQARSEVTRGQVAMVLALRGQWQASGRKAGEPLPARTGKPWSRGEDVVLGAAFAMGTGLAAVAQALSRTPGAVLLRAVHLELLPNAEPQAWPVDSARAA